MENMTVADYLALSGGNKESSIWGGNSGFLWIILIFLFFTAFSGNGILNNHAKCNSDNFNQVDRDVLTSSCNTQKEVLESRYTTQLGFQTTQAQLANCCCETNRNIDAVRADAFKNTCEITNAIHAEGEATRALITANTIQELRDSLQAAQLQLGNLSQTQTLINTLQPTPRPAYLTCSPYAAYNVGNPWGCGGCNNGIGI